MSRVKEIPGVSAHPAPTPPARVPGRLADAALAMSTSWVKLTAIRIHRRNGAVLRKLTHSPLKQVARAIMEQGRPEYSALIARLIKQPAPLHLLSWQGYYERLMRQASQGTLPTNKLSATITALQGALQHDLPADMRTELIRLITDLKWQRSQANEALQPLPAAAGEHFARKAQSGFDRRPAEQPR